MNSAIISFVTFMCVALLFETTAFPDGGDGGDGDGTSTIYYNINNMHN